ncbi:hypothetical protein BG003_007834 [Podila horticola]|nr:hypothetical protein BG003_007834 [Podila horticola]
MATSPVIHPTPLPAGIPGSAPSLLLSPMAVPPLATATDLEYPSTNPPRPVGRPGCIHAPRTGPFHINPIASAQVVQDDLTHNNPYLPPPRTSSCPFVSPKIPGYEFQGGSQAGHMGLMMGKRISDGTLVTGILQQSKVLLQHEHRIQRRLQFPDYRFEPSAPSPGSSKSGSDDTATSNSKRNKDPSKTCDEDMDKDSDELGLVENEKYFNRVVEDFLEIDQDDMSILILRRLGPNILSHHHHRFKGLEETDGYQNPRLHSRHVIVGSPFPDVYTFLVFCLKFSGVLEGLQRSNIAHLCICPTSLHWSAPECDEATKNKVIDRNPCNLYHDSEPSRAETPESFGESNGPQYPQFKCSSNGQIYTQEMPWDVNDTKIRLFEFAHAKILSHERARAPSNIFEWQIPGYLEYHLQFLAPEQTGRAETWMDHRTDIYSLGATLFSMLTMQYPNKGSDSVQILQGVLSRELPPLRDFRPDMPPIIDDILRKMTQKQPSQRYQSAHGLKQDILRCLNSLHKTGTIESFPLGAHDVSFHFVLPNAIFGRHVEQQMISAAIAQAASAYQQSLNCDEGSVCCDDDDMTATSTVDLNNSDHYVFEDDIVPLQNQGRTKISLSSKTLLRTPKPFDGGKSVHRGSESTDPVVRAIFVSGPSGVGKTVLIRGMATVARNSGLFAGGAFEAEGSEPYSAILSCIQSVLQQLLAQHTDALASLVVAIRTAFEPNSGIGIICDLIPEVRYFFKGSEMPKSKDIPLTHSVARFHALILKLIRVISTHFFMTWLIDDIHFADENSIALLATLVNVNKRLPIVLIMTHRDTPDCLVKVKQILGGGNATGNNHTGSYGTHGSIHQDPLLDEISSAGNSSSGLASMTKTTAIRATGLPLVVRGGGGVRFIRLQNPTLETIQEFLGVLLHHNKPDVLSLATVLNQKSWLSIRQLVLELYRNRTIFFDCHSRSWEWESDSSTLAQVVRKLAGEEYTFIKNRIEALDCDTKKILICAAICGSVVSIFDLQDLARKSYVFNVAHGQKHNPNYRPVEGVNSGNAAMAGMQNAIREGILVYTSNPDHLRFHHSIVRKISLDMLEGTAEKERLHFERAKISFRTPGQEFRTASHVLQCLDMVKKKLMPSNKGGEATETVPYWIPTDTEDDDCTELDIHALRAILSQAGEKSQKSGAQDMALLFWNAALQLLPGNCWDVPEMDSADVDMETGRPQKTPLYYEALKLHLQCVEAERWRERFDAAMDICNHLLSKTTDSIDRARVYQHKIEMLVWAYSQPAEATKLTIQCLQELGMSKDIDYNPSHDQIRVIYDETHLMLMARMDSLQSENPMVCNDPRIIMLMEVLSIANASLYYCNVPFLAVGVTESMKLVCKYGITKDAGRALVSFALTHSTWHGCLENAYELGRLACKVCKDNHHVKFLFHLTVQQWGDHVANSIPALEETLMAADMTCDRLFHTAGMIHVSVMRVLLARVHLRDCMAATMDLIAKQIEFGPKSHGVEVMQGILQLIKCLKGQTFSANPDTLFDDGDFVESRMHGKRDKALVMVHNNSTYVMLKIVAAFVFGHYAFIAEVTSTWHDDPKSMMNFEGSWIAHSIFTVVGLALVNLLRTELNPGVRESYKKQISVIHDCMETRANMYPTNHAAMFHLLQAEIADQEETKDLKKVLLLYEKSISYATTGVFPLQKAFCYELAAKCHLRHGLVTSGRCLLMNSCKTYQNWGATGKVNWFYKTYQDMFGSPPKMEATAPTRGLFYRPSDSDFYHSSGGHHLGHSGPHISSSSSGAESTLVSATSPWSSESPKTMYSPGGYGNDAVSAAAAAIAESAMATSMQTGCPSATSTSSSISAPMNTLQHNWTASPQSPEMDNADLDVLDFSSVIEAMQVIASEIDLDLLLVKSLGVLNQSVGAKRCCIIISKDQELVLSASQGDLGQCVSVNPPMEVGQCASLFHGVINYVINTSAPCLLTNAKDDPRFCADDYLKQRTDLRTVLCAPILHKTVMVGVLYMEEFPERAFANKRMLVMNLLVQQLGISITNALLYQSVLQSETKLNGLLENMPCGIALWDATAEECQYINSSWKDMTGYTVDEIMETGWHILTHADEVATYIQHWRDRVLAGVPCQWESRYRLKDGTYRWAIVRMLPIKSPSEHNKIIQWLTVTIDIDDQRRAVQLKSNFLANMSHELRTPFSGILGMLSLLRDSSGLSHEQFEFVDMAKASCEMLIRIVDDLLNFSKLEADKVTLEYIPLCFEEILGDVCDLLVPLASRKGLELIILIDDTLPLLLIGDPDRMKQILMNLIGNAIKFSTTGNVVIGFHHKMLKRSQAATSSSRTKARTLMHTHGPVTVQPITKSVSTETDEKKLGDEVVLHCSVKDQGIGLSPEEQKMLFVSFQQTDNGTTRKYGGTGLGLSICAQLIAHMHGKIEVDSVKGQGSTFSFTAKLRTMTTYDQEQSPAESSRIKECDVTLAARLNIIKDKKVLILSPNHQLREQIVRILKGAICSEFDNVITALESRAIGITGMEPSLAVEVGEPCSVSIPQFDFILVDHVLDTAELDRIYPSPTVAFVLLLAPTTETLRWILPPAAKKIEEEPEEEDSAQIDIGGRGRLLPSDSNSDVPGRIQLSPPTLISKGGLSTRDPSPSPSTTGKRSPMPRLSKKPSQLFKKRKHSRGPVTLARQEHQPQMIPGGTDADMGDDSGNKAPPKPTSSSSFQVYRLIKPVRRMKLLQILSNAITQHETGDHSVDRITELMDTDSAEEHDDGGDHSSDAYVGSSPAYSGSCQSSRTGSPSTDGTAHSESGLAKRRKSKVAGQKRTHSQNVDWSESDTSCDTGGNEARGRSRVTSEKQRRTMEDGNMPKRARNNDALTLLLSAEERKNCRGKNVLVAEDDFVSQKILEKQLSKLGMNVTIAGNGLEAVNQWLSVERGHYTIAIFDHHMPIMDGLAATKKLRALEAQEAQDPPGLALSIRIPIVGLSADIQQSTKESCIKAGMDEYMTKPLLTKGLALLIQRYCCS